MGKTPNLNPNPKQKQFRHASNGRQSPAVEAVTQTASDEDAYSFNQRRPVDQSINNGTGGVVYGVKYLTYNVALYTKDELHELRNRLVADVERIRSLRDRFESGKFTSINNSNPNPRCHVMKSKNLSGNKRPVKFDPTRNDPTRNDPAQWSRNDPTRNGPTRSDMKKGLNGVDNREVSVPAVVGKECLMECRMVLTKLMKQKNAWIFNKPVDAEAMGLHDYHVIVKRPMDLGTVKSNLAKSSYGTPSAFAADVRLTFENAMLYNPKTDQVHGFAEQLLEKFEELYNPIEVTMVKCDDGRRDNWGSSWNHIQTPERAKKPKAIPGPKKQEREQMQSHSNALTPSAPVQVQPLVPSPVSTSSPMRTMPVKPQAVAKKPKAIPPPLKKQEPTKSHSSGSTPSAPEQFQSRVSSMRQQSPVSTSSPMRPTTLVKSMKQPKPRAKDPNKREMTMEEKHKLGVGLQSLPQEKMPQLVQIIRKRNEHLAQDGDEIELDIESLDTETLWELDRFVTNWKKLVSKTKRQALMNNLGPPSATAGSFVATTSIAEAEGANGSDKNESSKKPKKGEAREDDDVDIDDDDMPVTSFAPIEIEKDEGGGKDHDAGSSSSSSSGSSSSDSDSGSSSGSDSDTADNAES